MHRLSDDGPIFVQALHQVGEVNYDCEPCPCTVPYILFLSSRYARLIRIASEARRHLR